MCPCAVMITKETSVELSTFTAIGHFRKQPSRRPTFLAMLFQILKGGMGLSLLDELDVRYHVIKLSAIQTDGGPKLRISRGMKAKTPGAVTACGSDAATRRNFYRPIDWTQEATMVNVTIFFTLRVFEVLDCYSPTLTQRSHFQVFLTADSQCFTRDDSRTFVPTIPRRRRAITSCKST